MQAEQNYGEGGELDGSLSMGARMSELPGGRLSHVELQ